MRSLAIAERDEGIILRPPTRSAIERLQMAQDNYHQPVLEREIVEFFASLPRWGVLDATLGGGGHAAAILAERLATDASWASTATPRPRAARRTTGAVTANECASWTRPSRRWPTSSPLTADFLGGEPIVGVLMDLGVSSHQLDDSSRGFSFRADAPLDMRMDPTQGETAAQYPAPRRPARTSCDCLRANGEDRFAGRDREVGRSNDNPRRPNELTEAVERAVPMAARRRGHVATRVFQALRIVVNDEVDQLELGLEAASDVLAPGGLLAVISYHSGEDRAVKAALHEAATGGCTAHTNSAASAAQCRA